MTSTKRPIRTPRENRALSTYVKLVRATTSLNARIHRHLRGHGLTESQFGVLEAIFHLGPLSQQELGKKILKTKGNITAVLDNLEKRGLVVRRHDREDQRWTIVHLTGQGERLIEDLFPRHAAVIRREMSTLSEEELDTLGRLCRVLGTGVRD